MLQRLRIHMGLGGRLLNITHALGAMGKRIAKKSLRPLAAVGLLCQHRRCFTWLAARVGGQVLAGDGLATQRMFQMQFIGLWMAFAGRRQPTCMDIWKAERSD